MATVGRVIVWMCMSTGVGCLIYALHILFAWPEPPPNPLDTSALSINTIAASVVAWGVTDCSSVAGGPLRLAVR
jgi:hypothetical protein